MPDSQDSPHSSGLSLIGSIAFSLNVACQSATVVLGWLANAMPGSIGSRLSDLTVQLIGHSGAWWFRLYTGLLLVPIGTLVFVLRSSRFRHILLRSAGVVSVLATFAAYWYWRRSDLVDALLALLSFLLICMMFLRLKGKIVPGWTFGVQVLSYYGMMAFVFHRIVFVPEIVYCPPVLGVIASVVWFGDVGAQAHKAAAS